MNKLPQPPAASHLIGDRALTEHEVADRLAISVAMVRRWRRSGQGPKFRKLGVCVRYALSDVLKFWAGLPGGGGGSKPPERNKDLDRPVEELELSVRSYNCLKNADIQTVGDLVLRTKRDLLGKKNFGKKSLIEVTSILNAKGLNLSPNTKNWRAG